LRSIDGPWSMQKNYGYSQHKHRKHGPMGIYAYTISENTPLPHVCIGPKRGLEQNKFQVAKYIRYISNMKQIISHDTPSTRSHP
jgi:hypothetical protein